MASVGLVQFVIYENERDNQPKAQTTPWDELAALLTEHEFTPCGATCVGRDCEFKKSLAWSPVIIRPGGRRKKEFVQAVTLAVFDIDHVSEVDLEALVVRVRGLEAVLHSTHNHKPPADCCVRLVVPLSRSLTYEEAVPFRNSVRDYFGIQVDQNTQTDESRLYYLPTAPTGTEAVAGRTTGSVLDVDGFLRQSKISLGKKLGMKVRIDLAPVPAGVVDMDELRKRMARYRAPERDSRPVAEAKARWVSRVLNGEPLATEGERDVAIYTTTGIIAAMLPTGAPVETLYEVLRPSVALIEGPASEGTWDDKLVYSCRQAHSWKQEYDAGKAAEIADWNAFFQHRQQSPGQQVQPRAAEVVTAAQSEVEAKDDPDEWKAALDLKEDKQGFLRLKATGHNAFVVLRSSPEWRGVLKYNEISKQVEYGRETPLGDVHALAPSVLATNVNNWFQHHTTYQLELSTQVIASQILAVARRCTYNPLQEYLEASHWDGVARGEFLLERYFNVSISDSLNGNIARYVRAVSKKWLFAAVARALEPGCKVDTVLVLQGGQGAKKSSAFEILGGKWFAGSQINLADKDSKLLAAQCWIIELAEMASLRRSETNQYKAFLSERVDKFRPPYAPTMEEHPRRCVFVGSTNDGHYLQDLSGNRRFWPVTCGMDIDLKGLARDRDQLWAEAVAWYRSRTGEFDWWFTDEEQDLANQQANARVKVPPRTDAILSWWLRQPIDKRPPFVRAHDIATDVLLLPTAQIDERAMDSVERALQYIGFVHTQIQEESYKAWVWAAPDEVRNAAQEQRRGFLKLVKPEGA